MTRKTKKNQPFEKFITQNEDNVEIKASNHAKCILSLVVVLLSLNPNFDFYLTKAIKTEKRNN